MEGALSEAEPTANASGEAADPATDSAVGAALLMSDLEAAIATAGDEIAALRRVTDAMPRTQPTGPQIGDTAAEPADAPAVVPLPPAASIVDRAVELGRNARPPAAAARRSPGNDADRATPAQAPAARPSPLPETAAGRAMPLQAAPHVSMTRFDIVGAQPTPADMSAWSAAPEIGGNGSTGNRLWPDQPPQARTRDEMRPWPSLPKQPVPRLPRDGTAVAAAPVFEPTAPGAAPVPSTDAPPDWSDEPHRAASTLEAVADRPAAPTAGAALDRQRPDRPAARAEPDAGGGDRATAGAAGAAVSGPSEGDVFLDGERVGRWMARHLSRELGGPAASGTAFDSRIGPAWPGALHGN